MARDGLAGFSMEAVAREAHVAGGLTRHYFGSREGMIIALVEDVLTEVQAIFLAPDGESSLAEQLNAYLDFTAANPWGHALWMHAGEIHPDLGRIVTDFRQRLAAEAGFGSEWKALTRAQQLAAIGWAGYIEALIAEWIAGGFKDRDALLLVLADAARRLDILDAARAGQEDAA